MAGRVRSRVGLLVVAGLLVFAPATAEAAWTSSISGNTVTMTEDGGGFPLTIGISGTNLRHSLMGQPGFASAEDFDSFNGGTQAIGNAASTTLTINGGTGFDSINIGDAVPPGSPASSIAASVNATGGGGNFDFLGVGDYGATTGRTVGVSPSAVSGFGGAISHGGFEAMGVLGSEGDDIVNIAAGVPELSVSGDKGNDRFALADGAKARIDAGAGNDTLDFSTWTTPVSTGAPLFGHFRADLTGGQEVTPSTSTATGTVFMSFDLVTGLVEFIFADVTGITPAQENGSHIQLGGPGVDGAVIYDLETGPNPDAAWGATAGGMTLNTLDGGIFPPSRLAELGTGNTYVNIKSTNLRCGPAGNQACTEGEIRGQLLPSDIGFTADATSGLFTGIENLIGGAAGDSLVANALANVIDGGPGPDTIRAAEGADFVSGGAGADDIGGGDGDDRLVANDGETDAAINCGPGTDIADRDFAFIDPDSILFECETVNTTVPVGAISPIKGRVKRNKDGTFTIITGATAECPLGATADCALSATARARVEVGGPGGRDAARKRKVTLGRSKATIAPGASKGVRIKLSRRGSRRFAADDPVRVNISINLDVPGGQPVTLTGGKRLKAPNPRR